MSTQYSNHRDTPLRRFNTFWWGLAYFGIFGLVSALVYCTTDKGKDVETLRAEQRMEIQSEVQEEQSKLLPSTGVGLEKVATSVEAIPKASEVFAPGTESHKKAMEALSQATGGGPGFDLYIAKTCGTCHGADANSPIVPDYPKLGGQTAEYLLAQIKDIHSGARANGQSAVMKATVDAVGMTEEEMKTVSDWMASLEKPKSKLGEGEGKNLYIAKACNSCHGPDGNTPLLPTYPRIAGQNAKYLLDQMKAIKDGTRANGQSAVMKAIMAGVTEEEMKVIAEWLAGQK